MAKLSSAETAVGASARQEANHKEWQIRRDLAERLVFAAAASDMDASSARDVLPVMYGALGIDRQDYMLALNRARMARSVKLGMSILPEVTVEDSEQLDSVASSIRYEVNRLHDTIASVREAAMGIRDVVTAGVQQAAESLPAVELYAHTLDEDGFLTIPVELERISFRQKTPPETGDN